VRLLLDTHALLWFAIGSSRLSVGARRGIESLHNETFVSAASAWEVCTKFRLGKLPEAAEFSVDFRERIRMLGFHELAITVEHGQRAGLLPGSHKDPFDRMLIAQAQAENLAIVSNERVFDEFHVRRLW
jgi:PIN domain nuclease of toxin-antitoxin system